MKISSTWLLWRYGFEVRRFGLQVIFTEGWHNSHHKLDKNVLEYVTKSEQFYYPGRVCRVKGNGGWSGQYRWYYYRCTNRRPIGGTNHQDANCRPMIGLILSREFLVCLYRADVPAKIFLPIIGLLVLDRCLGYYRFTNLRFIKARPILSLSFIHRLLIFNIAALVGPSFIDQSSLPQYWTDNQATLH